MTTWNKITKASGTSWTGIPKATGSTVLSGGTPIGLLLALTQTTISTADIWTKITKASGTSWTKITKAT